MVQAVLNLEKESGSTQGSYRSSTVKFPDFFLTFQVMEWQFPWPYQNNNPITQMLEMVHYILRFIIAMKHVIYEAILNAARESGEVL